MATYEKNPTEVVKLAKEVIQEHRPDLVSAGLKVDYLFAWPRYDKNGNPVGIALKQHGVQAIGLCKIVSLKDRVKGNADVEIQVDGEWWKTAPEPSRRAMLHHELYHPMLVINKHGKIETDAINRPKIKLRDHDFQVGWFAEIARVHGVHSIERQQAARCVDQMGQFFFPELLSAKSAGTRMQRLETKG